MHRAASILQQRIFMTSGIIFDVKRFALHDGPGLRTTVFLKGCPLSCLGCHNPEGQQTVPELLFRPDRCTACGDCVPACPQGALNLNDKGLQVAWDRCGLDGACVEVCLPGALEMVGGSKTVEEVLSVLEDDRIYFDESKGGVTFSGGEPFSQPDFLRSLLLGCRERELPVVLDTCGHVQPELFKELAPLASHILFDLKLLDEERHEIYTGVHNRWILANLRWAGGGFGIGDGPGTGDGSRAGEGLGKADSAAPRLTVRIPLIPGVNDDEGNLRKTARFVAKLERPPPVDVLPYHRLGVEKYHRTGRNYRLPDVEPPPEETVETAVRLLKDAGLEVTVRGEHYGQE